MTRKDYQIIAGVFKAEMKEWGDGGGSRDGVAEAALEDTAARLADALAADNPRFNRKTFMAACGFPEA